MKLEATERTFTLRLSEKAAQVLRGLVGNLCGINHPIAHELWKELLVYAVTPGGRFEDRDGNEIAAYFRENA